MRTRYVQDTSAIVVITALLTTIAIFVPVFALDVALGLPVLLYFPGYLVLAALFPHRDTLHGIERQAFSIGISLVVDSILGLLIDITPFGLTPTTVSVTLLVFTVIMFFVIRTRRRQTGATEVGRWHVQRSWTIPFKKTPLDIGLLVLLGLAVLGTGAAVGYVVTHRPASNPFTEFYVVSPDPAAKDYRFVTGPGEMTTVTVGIANHEGHPETYRVVLEGAGGVLDELDDLPVENETTWEGPAAFTLDTPGPDQPVTLLLFRSGQITPYLNLQLHVDVITEG